MGFHSRDRLVYVLGASPDCFQMHARYDKGEEPIKSQGRASLPAQAKIGMGPVCFRLINMSDHNRAGTHPPFCLKLIFKKDLIALHAPRS